MDWVIDYGDVHREGFVDVRTKSAVTDGFILLGSCIFFWRKGRAGTALSTLVTVLFMTALSAICPL